jgi:hypothetical protein
VVLDEKKFVICGMVILKFNAITVVPMELKGVTLNVQVEGMEKNDIF